MTDDQAPYIIRNLSVIVEEHPLGEAPSDPAVVPITVVPVNDQPILNSTQRTVASLDDYLPNNPGFYPSFLLSDTDVMDVDQRSPISQDFIGLAIISTQATSGIGVWQYWNVTWSDFPTVSDCYPLFLAQGERVRFLPAPSYDDIHGNAYGSAVLRYRAWDGSSQEVVCMNETVDITEGMHIILSETHSVFESLSILSERFSILLPSIYEGSQ